MTGKIRGESCSEGEVVVVQIKGDGDYIFKFFNSNYGKI